MEILEMQWRIHKIFLDFEIISFELVALDTRFYWERILFIRCQCVNKQSQDFRYYWNRIFWPDFLSEWPNHVTKIMLCRFKQSFGPFNMWTIHKCSETGLFRHLSDPTFCSLQFQKQMTAWWWYVGGPLSRHSIRLKMTINCSRSAK